MMFPSTSDVKSNLTVAFASCLGLVFLDKYHHIKQIIIIIIKRPRRGIKVTGYISRNIGLHCPLCVSSEGHGEYHGDHGECRGGPRGVCMGTMGSVMGTMGSVMGTTGGVHGECAWGPWVVYMGTTGSVMGTTGSVHGDHGECHGDYGKCAWGPWGVSWGLREVCMGTMGSVMGTTGSVHGDHGECAWGPGEVSWEPWGVFKATKWHCFNLRILHLGSTAWVPVTPKLWTGVTEFRYPINNFGFWGTQVSKSPPFLFWLFTKLENVAMEFQIQYKMSQ